MKSKQIYKSIMSRCQEAKKLNPDSIILIRIGGFYEAFEDDARIVSKVLGLSKTVANIEGNSIIMVRFPCHATVSYIEKLVAHGHKVAICKEL